jgi:hypothetical protein
LYEEKNEKCKLTTSININTNTSMITPMNMMEKAIAMRISTAIPMIMAMSTTIQITIKILIKIPIEKEE